MNSFNLSMVELALSVSVAVLAISLVWLARRYLILASQVQHQFQAMSKEVKAVQATSLGMGKKLRQMKPGSVKADKSEDLYLGKAEQQMMAALKRTAMTH